MMVGALSAPTIIQSPAERAELQQFEGSHVAIAVYRNLACIKKYISLGRSTHHRAVYV
ncbi:hypothetical protein [Leptolyngbya sp. AN02str]|uniref:hypothetical protein n=1 Tax=Leptolyngbya sp. AN02str TaxID=3423363 RepID=UPI003D318F44